MISIISTENKLKDRLLSLFGEKSPIRVLNEQKQIHDQKDLEEKILSFGYTSCIFDLLEHLFFVWKLLGCRDIFSQEEKETLRELNLRLDIPSSYYITEEDDKKVLIKLIDTENEGWIVDRLKPLLLIGEYTSF